MKKLLRFLLFLLLIIYLIIIFMPKKELFYLAEEYLAKERVVLSGERHSDYGLIFRIDGGVLYYDRLESAKLGSFTLIPLVFYNQANLNSVQLSGALASLIPDKIESARAIHTLFLPHIIFLSAKGSFGTLDGKVDLYNRRVELTIDAPSAVVNKYRQLFSQMKKGENGFVYQSSF